MREAESLFYYLILSFFLLSHTILIAQTVKGKSAKEQVIKNLGVSEDIIDDVTGGIVIEDIIEPIAEYHYASFSKEDPFIAPVLIKEKPQFDMEEVPIVSPLQNYELSALKLVGIWQSNQNVRKGLIMTNDNEGVIVKVSDPIGRHGGKILVIGEQSLTVREIVYSPDGLRQYEDMEMTIQKSNEKEVSYVRRAPITLGRSGSYNNHSGQNSAPNAVTVPAGSANLGVGNGVSGTVGFNNDQATYQASSPGNLPTTTGGNPYGNGTTPGYAVPGSAGSGRQPNVFDGLPPEAIQQIIEASQPQTAPFPYEGTQ